jgi:hypothetical protein
MRHYSKGRRLEKPISGSVFQGLEDFRPVFPKVGKIHPLFCHCPEIAAGILWRTAKREGRRAVMNRYSILLGSMLLASSFGIPSAAQSIYQIHSGEYRVLGGFYQQLPHSLPEGDHSFVALSIDTNTERACLWFLRRDSTPTPPVLINGVISGNQIQFSYTRPPSSDDAPAEWLKATSVRVNFTVTNTADSLWLAGSNILSFAPSVCADCIYGIQYSNVQAAGKFAISACETSPSELCWGASSGRTYQLRYKPDLTSGTWTNVGPPVEADSSRVCVEHTAVLTETQGFYQVVILP